MPISKLSFFFLKKIFIPSLCLFILLNSSLHSQENPSPPVQRSAFEEYLFGKPIPAQNISVADPKQNMTIPPKIYLKKIQGEVGIGEIYLSSRQGGIFVPKGGSISDLNLFFSYKGFGLELERFYMQNGETPASYYTLTGADKNDFDPSADAIYLRAKLNATLICGRYEYMFGKVIFEQVLYFSVSLGICESIAAVYSVELLKAFEKHFYYYRVYESETLIYQEFKGRVRRYNLDFYMYISAYINLSFKILYLNGDFEKKTLVYAKGQPNEKIWDVEPRFSGYGGMVSLGLNGQF